MSVKRIISLLCALFVFVFLSLSILRIRCHLYFLERWSSGLELFFLLFLLLIPHSIRVDPWLDLFFHQLLVQLFCQHVLEIFFRVW